MKVSIIIVNYNTPEYTTRAVDAVYHFTNSVDFEVLLVDNGSKDETIGSVLERFPQVRLLKSGFNLGFSKGNNLAVPYASGEYIALLNSDAFLLNDAFGEMCHYLADHPKCGVAGAQLVSESGEVQQSIFKAPTAIGLMVNLLLGSKYPRISENEFAVSSFDYNHTRRVIGGVSGACLVLRRELAEDNVILDPNYFFCLEDVDLCYSAMKKGWEIHYCASARVMHIGGASQRTEKLSESIRRRELYWLSVKHFFNKHHNPVHAAAFRVLIGILFAFRWASRSFLARIIRNPDTRLKAAYNRRVTLMLLK